jgi:4-hydroxybenzoate polyprenyltransferase
MLKESAQTIPTAPVDAPPSAMATGRALLYALRPWQWVKNLLLGVPLVLAHQLRDATRLRDVIGAFVCFSLCASAGYVLNDLRDRESDRHHPVKRRRPFASGALSATVGWVLAASLYGIAAAGSILWLPKPFTALLAVYAVLAIFYSWLFKHRLLVDVFLLVGLYTLRVLAGGAAARVPVTAWLLAFCMFLFLSLAFLKRYAELMRLERESATAARGRAYRVEDLGIIESVGPASGYLAVLVLALYINQSQQALQLYRSPGALWLMCPVLLYWLTRLWFVAKRQGMSEDPVLYAITDRVSWGVAAAVAVILGLAWAGAPFL